MSEFRTVEQLLTYWNQPMGPLEEPKSLRALLQEAYERGRMDKGTEDLDEMDSRADDLITKVETVLGAFRAEVRTRR